MIKAGKAPIGTTVAYRTAKGKWKEEAVDRIVGGQAWQGYTIVTVSGHRIPYGDGVLMGPPTKRNPRDSKAAPTGMTIRYRSGANAWTTERVARVIKATNFMPRIYVTESGARVEEGAGVVSRPKAAKRENPGERQRAAALAFAMHRAPAETRDRYATEFRKWDAAADAVDKAAGRPKWGGGTHTNPHASRAPRAHNPTSYRSPLAKRQDIRGVARGAGAFLREARTGGHPYWAFSRWQSSDYTDKQAYAQLERALGVKFMRSATHPRADRAFWDGEIEGAILSRYGLPA